MFDDTYRPAALAPVQGDAIRVLDASEIDEVSGGFVCGGLCLAGVAFGAGALFGSGVAIGYHAAQ